MSKKRVYEYARENKISSKEVLEAAKEVGINYSSHMSSMEESDVGKINQVLNKTSNNKKVETKNANRNEQDKRQSKPNNQPVIEKHSQNQKQKPTTDKPATSKKQVKNSSQQQASQNEYSGQANRRYGNQNNNKRRKNNRGKQNRNDHRKGTDKKGAPPRKFKELPEVLVYTEGMNVAEIAKKIHREPAEILKKLLLVGVMTNQNQPLSNEAIELLAIEYGITAELKVEKDITDLDLYFEEAKAEAVSDLDELVERAPVVTIMGHVDHGKTTLLDQLRNTKVTEGEAGGITQHIGAYQVKIDGKPITFLDTPGHAAFTTMRARGADVTDITIIVVAADDGVMPQTVEAINHAKDAQVPIIVAVNKIDKPTANPDQVMTELSEHGLIPEAWGGDTIFVNISAKFNTNIDELLEMIILVSEIQEIKANPNRLALGTVIEARLDKAKGPIATLLVQEGTLNIGDPIVVGNTHGRVRAMINDQGRRVKTANPATPIEITGLNVAPQAGDRFVVFEDEKTARQVGEERAERAQAVKRSQNQRITLDNLFESLQEGELKNVNVIIKADVQGSAEALSASLQKIEVEGVKVSIVHSAVGAINESDISLALASNSIVIGFNVRPTPQAKSEADAEQVDIRLHSVIYNVIDEIETAMKGMLDPEYKEQVTGQLSVRETYQVSKLGTIAGAFVTDGIIKRSSHVRIIRNGIVIHDGEITSLKRFKDDMKEVKKGFECGIMFENYNDVKVDDIIEAYEMVEIKPK
ncbi:translation initiation factor IF-2 [Atopobacter phocae]|uniref:translation initiation factor IF-2 n=1 Tax=Atopobacter phocae TaxID=136492 RepID=UPI00046E9E9B|nr:translation initiation factor IF-2 [Atopobacter phocae]